MLKIVSWNLMRPNSQTVSRNIFFIETLKEINPDIVILTETNSIIDLGDEYSTLSTDILPEPETNDNIIYKLGENRVSIFSKNPFTRKLPTYNRFRAVCAETTTEFGTLIVYGTVTGYLGGKLDPFAKDFESQMKDLETFSKLGNVCYSGDLNITFSGYTYPSKIYREKAVLNFEKLSMKNVTENIKDSVIHIVLSNSFLEAKVPDATSVKYDEKLTDHNLIVLTLK